MIICRRLSKMEDFVYLFLYIFSLQLPVVKTSSLLLVILLPLRFLFCRGCFGIVKQIFGNRYVVKLFVIYLVIIFYSILMTTLHQQMDFTLLPTLFNLILHLIIGIFLVGFLIYKRYDFSDILHILISLFVVQAIIELVAFFSPALRSFVQIFQGADSAELASQFAGRRGLALAGTVFFGLAALYGMVFLFFVKKIIDSRKFVFKDVLCGLLLLVGGFFIGRTFYIGVGMAGIYYLCSPFPFRTKLIVIMKVLIFVFLLAVIAWSLLPLEIQMKVFNLLLYALEFLFNYLAYGSLSTTSSTNLFDNMYFPMSLSTFFFGDGLYTSLTGGYYMHTDAGYMRNILYMGVGGLLILMLADVFLLFGHKALRKGETLKLGIFLYLYMAVIHIKGEVFGYLLMLHCFLFIYYLSYLFIKQKPYDQCNYSNL